MFGLYFLVIASFLFLFSYISEIAALPSSYLSITNTTDSVALNGVSNICLTQNNSNNTSPNLLAAPRYRLKVMDVGQKLDITETSQLLDEAVAEAEYKASVRPYQPIDNHHYELRIKFPAAGHLLALLISELQGSDFNWAQLSEILFAVRSYVTGCWPGPRPPHYNVLYFRIRTSDQDTDIGFGQLTQLELDSQAVSKRDSSAAAFDPSSNIPFSLEDSETNRISTRALNQLPSDLNMTSAMNTTNEIRFHIPDTSIDLVFTALGNPIPIAPVYEAIENAIQVIASNVTVRPEEQVTRNGFRFRQPILGSAGSIYIFIHGYSGQILTWGLLDQLLLGLEGFMFSSGNWRDLEFEFYVAGGDARGGGTIYTRPSEVMV